MPQCNHKEADTRNVVHVHHTLETEQASTVLARTVETDVVVIVVGMFHHLKTIQRNLDLWVAFGMGCNFKLLSVNAICAGLDEAWSTSLPVFHTLSGCDTTSAFYGKGRSSAWQAWLLYPDSTVFSDREFIHGLFFKN